MSSGRNPPQEAGNTAGTSEPFYTNEDVAVLHDIVVLAQQILPTLPKAERLSTNALFNAYYDILPRVGLDADHDSRYARILFKIGGLRNQGSMYEKFEEVLSRMGIEIEFDHEDEDGEEIRGSNSNDTQTGGAENFQDEPHLQRGRTRRNSESSIWHNAKDKPQPKDRQRRSSYSRVGPTKQVLASQAMPDSQPQFQFLDKSVWSSTYGERNPGNNVTPWLNAKPKASLPLWNRSLSAHSSVRIHRGSAPGTPIHREQQRDPSSPTSDEYQAESEITAVTSNLDEEFGNPTGAFQAGLFAKAETRLQFTIQASVKELIGVWRSKAMQAQEDSGNLQSLATHHDRIALLYQAWETWHTRLAEKRNIAETDRFFSHLERRSVRARELYLLHRAFTHWNIQAYEESQRTSIARRHILRARTFNAWRDITAINELKVRRQVLKKFFATWKNRHLVVSTAKTTAVIKYEEDLVLKAFNYWIRKIWETKALICWSERSKYRILFLWHSAALQVSERDHRSEKRQRLQLLRKFWRVWKDITDIHSRRDQQAISSHRKVLCVNTLRKWRRETCIMPVKNTLQTDIASRLLRNSFTKWHHRSHQEKHATDIDHSRVLREAWTHWRHELRSRLVRARANDRIVLETVYKWVLGERMVLATRLFDQRLLSRYLRNWVGKAQTSKQKAWVNDNFAQDAAIQHAQRITLQRWHSVTRAQRQLESDAVDVHTPKILKGMLTNWLLRKSHIDQLQQWSRDAEFYVFTSKTLKLWKASAEAARREKRKSAYTHVRRTSKLNLARDVLLGWHHKTHQLLDLEARAEAWKHNRNVVVGMNIFDRWRARTEELDDMKTFWREKVLMKRFTIWKDRSSAFRDVNFEAIVNFQERRESEAMNKWKLAGLKVQAQLDSATKIRERSVKRTFRKTFIYWRQSAVQRRPAKQVDSNVEIAQIGPALNSEGWSEMGDDNVTEEWAHRLDGPITSVPLAIPGYLNTPSKRAGRVTAVAARLSTTPRGPLSTKSERQLRAQYSKGFLPSTRHGPGRSALGTDGGFADIIDKTNK